MVEGRGRGGGVICSLLYKSSLLSSNSANFEEAIQETSKRPSPLLPSINTRRKVWDMEEGSADGEDLVQGVWGGMREGEGEERAESTRRRGDHGARKRYMERRGNEEGGGISLCPLCPKCPIGA